MSFGGKSASRHARRQERIAQEQRRELLARFAQERGLFDTRAERMRRELTGYEARGGMERYRGLMGSLGLLGGPTADRAFQIAPSEDEMDAWRAQVEALQSAANPTQSYKGLSIPDDADPEVFKAEVDRVDQAHTARYGMSFFSPRARQEPTWGAEAQEMGNRARNISSSRGYVPRSQRPAPELPPMPQARTETVPGGPSRPFEVSGPMGRAVMEGGDVRYELSPEMSALQKQFFGELEGYSPERAAQTELDLYRRLAEPQERRARREMEDVLFSRGQLGTTGGGLQTEALQRAQAEADIERTLSALGGSRAEQQRLLENYMGIGREPVTLFQPHMLQRQQAIEGLLGYSGRAEMDAPGDIIDRLMELYRTDIEGRGSLFGGEMQGLQGSSQDILAAAQKRGQASASQGAFWDSLIEAAIGAATGGTGGLALSAGKSLFAGGGPQARTLPSGRVSHTWRGAR